MWSGKEVREEKGGRGEGRISQQGVRGTKETRIAFEMDKSRVFQQEDTGFDFSPNWTDM